MLVYANHLEIVGKNPALQVLRAVSGWLSEKLDQRIIIRDVTKPGEVTGGEPRAWLRTDAADADGFKLYSWILKHPDAAISRRQWVTELGLKENEGGIAEFSCVVQTEEQSILVSEPVEASRPRVVRFVFDNVENEADVRFSPETIGSTPRWIGESLDSYRGLLADIEAIDRRYPIVVVSPNNDGTYVVDPTRLQKTLFGLAQVVGVHLDYDSYEMKEALGRKYSAWAGAISIVRMAHRDGSIYSSLILPRDIPISCSSAHKKECFILGRVSHNTNVPQQRNRIRPEGVRTLAIRGRLQRRLRDLSVKPDSSIRGELEMVYEEMETLTDQLTQSQLAKDAVELTLLEREEQIQELEKQLRVRGLRKAGA